MFIFSLVGSVLVEHLGDLPSVAPFLS